MPFGGALTVGLIGAGSGILGSIFGGKPKTTTSTTTPTWSPEMAALRDRLTAYSDGMMTNPEQGTDPIRKAGLDHINRTYMDIAPRLASKFAARGYGSSGDFGGSLYNTEYQRGGAMSDFEGLIAQMVNNNRNVGANMGQQLLQTTRGSTTTGTGPGTGLSDGLQSGASALSNMSTLLSMNQIMKGMGNGGGTVTNFDPYGGYQASVTGPGSGIGGL